MKPDIKTSEANFHDSLISQKARRERDFYTYESMQDIIKTQNEFLGDIKGKKVLDYGCGTGWLTIELLSKGAVVSSIDISPKSIEETIKKVNDFNFQNHSAHIMDCEDLKFPDESFDVICGNGILHHLNLDYALNEINRVLKKGGHAVFYEPLGKNPAVNLYRLLTPNSRTKNEHPLGKKDLIKITQTFSDYSFYYFGLFDCFSKIFCVLNLKKTQHALSRFLKKLDRKILGGETKKISFINTLSWIVVMKLVK